MNGLRRVSVGADASTASANSVLQACVGGCLVVRPVL